MQDKSFNIGWTFGSPTQDLALSYAQAISDLVAAGAYRRTILAGHSAGGFSAARIGLAISNSISIVMNGQFDMGIHRKWAITKLRKKLAVEMQDDMEFIDAYRTRLDLRSALDNRAPGSRVVWFAQFDDHPSFGDYPHFHAYVDHLNIPREGGESQWGDLGVITHYAHKEGNAHGVPGTVVPFIEAALGEPISMDLGIDADVLDESRLHWCQAKGAPVAE